MSGEEFVNFLNYIGITKKTQQNKIIRCCKSSIKNSVRRSKFYDLLEQTGLEEPAVEKIVLYLTNQNFKDVMNEEIKLSTGKGAWGMSK